MPTREPKATCPQIAVVIVNYSTAQLTIAAVESVLSREHGGRSLEVHVVENASPGADSAELLRAHETRAWGDRVKLWIENENHGFGRGNNLVLRELADRSTPPIFVFLLNPDAELDNEAIDILASSLEANREAAVAGAAIRYPNGDKASACFRFPTMLRELVAAVDFGPIDRLVPNSRVPLPPDRSAGDVDWVAGASVLFRFEALRDVGFFDPDFFLYYEEVELMRRLLTAGYRTIYVPEAQVVHIAGAATNVASYDTRRKIRPAYVYESWRMYFVKRHGRLYAGITALLLFPAAGLGLILARLRGRNSPLPVSYFRHHWRYVVSPILRGIQK